MTEQPGVSVSDSLAERKRKAFELIEQGMTAREAAAAIGVHESRISRWRKQAQAHSETHAVVPTVVAERKRPVNTPASGIAASGIPARGLRRFEPGHEVNLRHGAYLPEVKLSRDPRVAELAEMIAASSPVVHAADQTTIQRLAIALARIERATGALEAAEHAHEEDPEAPLPAERLVSDLRAWIREANRLEEMLGRPAAARARLNLDAVRGQAELQRYLAERYGTEIDAGA